jgi:proline dehydrogenase
MLDLISKGLFQLLASSEGLQSLASAYGMRRYGFARRFIAGEGIHEATEVAQQLEKEGLTTTLDLLGERVTKPHEAKRATREYLQIADAMIDADICRNLSLKLSQLGLDVDRATAIDNLRRILDFGQRFDFFIRIDMEGSRYTQATLDMFETVWHLGYRNVGIVLQTALRRTTDDVHRMIRLGARVRLVKGAYKESWAIAYASKREVDHAYVRLAEALLTRGLYPALATHDPRILEMAKTMARANGIGPDQFEFQMLYGIRRDLQLRLLKEGYRVRVYIPFGREWFPYFMRRLGERPANVAFVVRSLLRER